MARGKLIWIRAETFIHAGIGQQASVIDLPFARERTTGYPYIPGSSMKGAIQDAYWVGKRAASGKGNETTQKKKQVTGNIFGEQDHAGTVLFSDARLAFLPVRTLGDSYRYVTSPGLLKRIERDVEFAGVGNWPFKDRDIAENRAFCPKQNGKQIFLEEFPFEIDNADRKWEAPPTMPSGVASEIERRLVVIRDEDFDYFARHGLHVRQRNSLDAATKTVNETALWSEESLPPDTLMYMVLMPRVLAATTGQGGKSDLDELLDTLFGETCGGYFQVGGNETVGEGWFRMLKAEGDVKGGGNAKAAQVSV